MNVRNTDKTLSADALCIIITWSWKNIFIDSGQRGDMAAGFPSSYIISLSQRLWLSVYFGVGTTGIYKMF